MCIKRPMSHTACHTPNLTTAYSVPKTAKLPLTIVAYVYVIEIVHRFLGYWSDIVEPNEP
jgi:hypothetical protein